MTVTTGIDMPGVIRKLARIYDDHQLEALIHDYAADCRGLTADGSQLHTASELMRMRSVTNALVQMCEFCPKEIEPMVRAVLLAHPAAARARLRSWTNTRTTLSTSTSFNTNEKGARDHERLTCNRLRTGR